MKTINVELNLAEYHVIKDALCRYRCDIPETENNAYTIKMLDHIYNKLGELSDGFYKEEQR